jgi:hypothetical protein
MITDWELAIGIMSILMAIATGVIMVIVFVKHLIQEKPIPVKFFFTFWICISIILLGIVSIISILCVEMY